MKWLLINLIKLYQLIISPLLGQRCRFYPSCSHYSLDAIQFHGATRGSILSVKRLIKCHPFHPGGVDLVPNQYQTTRR
ncbi:membrane protein insertion efficiency factor YidD [bacterium]|nr:membrane protein insertion efficiency factor YidD [bacterium]